MPTIRSTLTAAKLWNAKPRISSGVSTSMFSVAYEDESDHGNDSRVPILIATTFIPVLIVGVVVVFFIVARRHRARKRAKNLTNAHPEKTMHGKEALRVEPLRLKTETNTDAQTPAAPPALRSTEPRYVYSKTAPVLEATPSIPESPKVPVICASSLEEEGLSASLSNSDLNILPGSALRKEDPPAKEDEGRIEARCGVGSEGANTTVSFFSGEMLEELYSIAEDVKRFSLAKSIDREVKGVNSMRSSVIVIDQDIERQPISCDVEGDKDCSSREKWIETIGDILSEREGMASRTSNDDSRTFYEDALSSRACSTSSMHTFGSPGKELHQTEYLMLQECSRSLSSIIDESGGSSRPPATASGSANTTLDDDTLVDSPGKKAEMEALTSFVFEFGLARVTNKSLHSSGSLSSFYSLSSCSGVRHGSADPATLHAGDDCDPKAAGSEVAFARPSGPRPALSRPALAAIKSASQLIQTLCIARRSHVRTSSQVLAKNHSSESRP